MSDAPRQAEISELLRAVGRLEAISSQQGMQIDRLTNAVEGLVKAQEAQAANVDAFWKHGKGEQWDRDIRANTQALKELDARLEGLAGDYQTSRAKLIGLLTGSAVAGGGIAETLHRWLGS